MKDKDIMRLEQVEESLAPFRMVMGIQVPRGGWVKAIQGALGMTNVQLARRMRKVPQTIEDMQQYEAAGTIKLKTLRELAEALDCQLVYSLVPKKTLDEIRIEQARKIARTQLKITSHSMELENQGVGPDVEERQLQRLVAKLLAGNPKKLWG